MVEEGMSRWLRRGARRVRRVCWRGLTEKGGIRSEEGWARVAKEDWDLAKGVNQRDKWERKQAR